MVYLWYTSSALAAQHVALPHGAFAHRHAYFHSARSTSTTDLKANHSGISSPARSIWRNLVPESFFTSRPFSLASSAVIYSNVVSSPVQTRLSDGTGVTPSSSAFALAKSCASKAP